MFLTGNRKPPGACENQVGSPRRLTMLVAQVGEYHIKKMVAMEIAFMIPLGCL